MSRIDALIAEHCPDGVGYKRLGSVCEVFNGFAFKSEFFNSDGTGLPLIRIRDVNTGFSETYYSGEYDNRWVANCGDILIGMDGDFRAARWKHGKALLNQRVCRLQAFKPEILPGFLFYKVQDELDRIQDGTHGSTVRHLSSRELERSRIPIPPLEVQREIVRVLDAFRELEAELEAELQAELEARRRQYQYYRDALLTFDEQAKRASWMALGDMGTVFGGLTGKSKADFSDGNARFVSYVNAYNNIAVDVAANDFVKVAEGERQRALQRGDIVFTGSSETPEDVGMSSVVTAELDEPVYLNSFCIGFRPNDPNMLDPEFSKHLFRSEALRTQIVRTASGVTRFNVSKARLAKVRVPVPQLGEQKRIAAVLDKFDALVNDLSSGLPAEIAARRQQYEHYRDRLLTFPEAA